MSHESIRPLFEDPNAPEALRDFVELARADGPSEVDLDRLAKRMAPVLGVSAGVLAAQGAAAAFGSPPSGLVAGLGASGTGSALSGGATVSAGGAASITPAAASVAVSGAKAGLMGQLLASTSAKLIALGVSAGVAGVGVWEMRERPEPAPQHAAAPTRSAVVRPKPQRAIPAPAEPAVEVAAKAQTAAAEHEEVALSTGSARATRSIARAGARPRAPAAQPAGSGVRSPAVGARASADVAPSSAAPVAASTPIARPEPPTTLLDASAPEPSAPPPSELGLIQQAEAARGDAQRALALLGRHAALYPHGALAQEREVLAVEMLLKAGQLKPARARAASFERAYPGSAHWPRVRALLTRAGVSAP